MGSPNFARLFLVVAGALSRPQSSSIGFISLQISLPQSYSRAAPNSEDPWILVAPSDDVILHNWLWGEGGIGHVILFVVGRARGRRALGTPAMPWADVFSRAGEAGANNLGSCRLPVPTAKSPSHVTDEED